MIIFFKGLNDSTMYSGVPPPPASELPAVLPICPPPPGFSDSEHSLSDCDSLGSEPGQEPSSFQRFGFSRVSKPRSLAVPSLQEQLRMDRAVGQVSMNTTTVLLIPLNLSFLAQGFQTMPARKSMSGILEAAPVPAGKGHTSFDGIFRRKLSLSH